MIALFNSASNSPAASLALAYPSPALARFANAPGIAPKNDDTLPTTIEGRSQPTSVNTPANCNTKVYNGRIDPNCSSENSSVSSESDSDNEYM